MFTISEDVRIVADGQVILLEAGDAISAETQTEVSYSGIILDEQSRHKLLSTFKDKIPAGWKTYAHHMTICLGALPDKALVGSKQLLKATKLGMSDAAMAVAVESKVESTNKIPHITIAIGSNGRPKDSNAIESWVDIEPMLLTGIIEEVPFPKLKISEDVEIIADGYRILLEAGEEVSVLRKDKIQTNAGPVSVGNQITFTMGPGHKDTATVKQVDTSYKDLKNKGRVEVIDSSKRVLWVYPSQIISKELFATDVNDRMLMCNKKAISDKPGTYGCGKITRHHYDGAWDNGKHSWTCTKCHNTFAHQEGPDDIGASNAS